MSTQHFVGFRLAIGIVRGQRNRERDQLVG